ncbi:DUF6586 family protein [Endozoicomonas numazuensis]|nr:DUF6586 family protein [Endozoicomonas numazuensis]
MSDQWRSYTNKKLHYARLQLDAWERAEPFEQESYREAFLMHACQAYSSILAEVLYPYGKQLDRLVSLKEACDLMSDREGDVAELEQLKQLEASDGWLVHLQQAYSHLSVLEGATQSSPSMTGAVMITSDSGGLTSGVKTPESGKSILASLKELAGHFRNFNLEW